MRLEPADIANQRELAELLPILVNKAVSCKLTITARLIDEAVKAIGWEIADRREADTILREADSKLLQAIQQRDDTSEWEKYPDRMGGMFTAQEIADAEKWT